LRNQRKKSGLKKLLDKYLQNMQEYYYTLKKGISNSGNESGILTRGNHLILILLKLFGSFITSAFD
jgi:hypothetical protein